MHGNARGFIRAWGPAAGAAMAMVSLSVIARSEAAFVPACGLPFQEIAVTHAIDKTCGIAGETNSPATRAQNRAKNNLCAAGGSALVRMEDLRRLQDAVVEARIPFGTPSRLPSDRSRLAGLIQTSDGARIGEGSVVQFVGFVLEAHVSDRARGESVNCYQPGDKSNDIHFTVADTPDARLCDGFVAEMIPHLRPSSWSAEHLNALRGQAVRIVGHLLFDAGHQACKEGKRVGSNPARASLWEIHPVYAVDVCLQTDPEQCRAGDSAPWKPLHEWVGR